MNLHFSIKITFVSFKNPNFFETKKNELNFLPLRRDIVDRNGELISRNIKSYHAAVKPNLILDKKKFLINIQLNFPEISQDELKKNLKKNKYFYLKKRITDEEKNKLWYGISNDFEYTKNILHELKENIENIYT